MWDVTLAELVHFCNTTVQYNVSLSENPGIQVSSLFVPLFFLKNDIFVYKINSFHIVEKFFYLFLDAFFFKVLLPIQRGF